MTSVIREQADFVLATFCNGMLLMLGYDVIRILRWIWHHGRVMRWVEPLVYWGIASIFSFLLFLQYNNGILRWYGVPGLLTGSLLYECGFSTLIRGRIAVPMNQMRSKVVGVIQHLYQSYRKKRENNRHNRQKDNNKGLRKR